MSTEELRHELNSINNETDELITQGRENHQEVQRVSSIIERTPQILDDLDAEFCRRTKLTPTDVAFMFLATGLQIARQYLLSNEKCRVTAKQGDKIVENTLSLAPPSWQEILTQSVPYDAIVGSKRYNAGLSGATHRYRTLGHDPVLGWFFGTANIMTNSLTKTDLETYQVKGMRIIRHYPLGVAGMIERAISYSIDDPKLLAVSVARQGIHFGSDYFTKMGLPIPIVATVNNDLAKDMLSKWKIDSWSITRSAVLATFINQLIAFIHKLFYDGNTDEKLYEVRTRKILMYSNLIASSSNVAVVAITKDMTKLDIGGLAVTIYNLITSQQFISQVKYDFIFGSYRDMISGDI